MAVDDAHVYWTNFNSGAIGRANLDGSGVNQSFITGASGPSGVALGALGKASAKPTQRQRGTRIRVAVKVQAEERLTAKARGEIKIQTTHKLKPKTVEVAAGKTVTLKLKPTRKARARIAEALRRRGRTQGGGEARGEAHRRER